MSRSDKIRERINYHWKLNSYFVDLDGNEIPEVEYEEHEWAYGPDVPFEPIAKRYWLKDGDECFLIRRDLKHMTYTWEPREYHT